MLMSQFFGAADGGGSPSKKRRVSGENSEQAEGSAHRKDAFEDAMPGYHEEADADDEADKDAMHIGLAEEVMAMVDPDDASGRNAAPTDTHSAHPRPPNSAPPTASQSSVKPMSSSYSRQPNARASSTAPSASGSATRTRRTRSPSLRAPSESAPGAVTQTCPICSRTMVTDNDGLNAHIDFCLSKEAIREAQATQVGVPATGAGEQTKGFKPKSVADLLSGSSKKRVAAPSPGLTEGSRRRKRKKP